MKILLLCDIPPCTNFTSGLVLDQLCRFLPEGSAVCCCALAREYHPVVSEELDWLPIEYYERPRERMYRFPRLPALNFLLSYSLDHYNVLFRYPTLVRRITAFAKRHGVDRVWATLQGQTLIRLAGAVAKRLNVPLHTEIFDPPFWWLREHRVDHVTSREVVRAYERAIAVSARCGAASEVMAEEYQARYGTPCTPLLPSLDARLIYPPATRPADDGTLTIALAGQIYASEEWRALIRALQEVNWVIAGRAVRVQVYGRGFNFDTQGPTHIEFLGWHSQPDTIAALARADILYCPYWFDPTFEVEARLSFPSKLTSYMAAGRPTFFHGPAYASPGRFLTRHQAGYCCHSLDAARIIDGLTALATDAALYGAITARAHDTLRQYLTLTSLRAHFAEFLALDPRELRPLEAALPC